MKSLILILSLMLSFSANANDLRADLCAEHFINNAVVDCINSEADVEKINACANAFEYQGSKIRCVLSTADTVLVQTCGDRYQGRPDGHIMRCLERGY